MENGSSLPIYGEYTPKFRKCRIQNKWTQEQTAKYLGITAKTYRAYEQLRIVPPGEELIRLANCYGVSVDYLLGRSPEYTTIENTFIGEQLRLSEKAIQVLKNLDASLLIEHPSTYMEDSDGTRHYSGKVRISPESTQKGNDGSMFQKINLLSVLIEQEEFPKLIQQLESYISYAGAASDCNAKLLPSFKISADDMRGFGYEVFPAFEYARIVFNDEIIPTLRQLLGELAKQQDSMAWRVCHDYDEVK